MVCGSMADCQRRRTVWGGVPATVCRGWEGQLRAAASSTAARDGMGWMQKAGGTNIGRLIPIGSFLDVAADVAEAVLRSPLCVWWMQGLEPAELLLPAALGTLSRCGRERVALRGLAPTAIKEQHQQQTVDGGMVCCGMVWRVDAQYTVPHRTAVCGGLQDRRGTSESVAGKENDGSSSRLAAAAAAS